MISALLLAGLVTGSAFVEAHAGNLVSWRVWDDAGRRTAREAGRPVVLSIGYQGCPGCERMARESFNDPDIANLLNDRFTSLLLDAEAQPEAARQFALLAGALGAEQRYPVNLVLTPALEPYLAFGYLPPRGDGARVGWHETLMAALERFHSDPAGGGEAGRAGRSLLGSLDAAAPGGRLEPGLRQEAMRRLKAAYDDEHGGFGQAPKSLPSTALSFLLREDYERHDSVARRMVTQTIDAILASPLRSGALFRSGSYDAGWRTPREGVDAAQNALFATVLLEAGRRLDRPAYEEAACALLAALAAGEAAPQGAAASGVVISALARATQRFERHDWSLAAARLADQALAQVDAKADLDALALLAIGLLDLFEADFAPSRLDQARALLAQAEQELSGGAGGFYAQPADAALPVRERRAADGLLPAGNPKLAEAMLRLARLTEEAPLRSRAGEVLDHFAAAAADAPERHLGLLLADRWRSGELPAVAVVGAPEPAAPLLRVARQAPLPERLVVWLDPARPEAEELSRRVALFNERGPGRGARAYVCTTDSCLRPVDQPSALSEQLRRLAGGPDS